MVDRNKHIVVVCYRNRPCSPLMGYARSPYNSLLTSLCSRDCQKPHGSSNPKLKKGNQESRPTWYVERLGLRGEGQRRQEPSQACLREVSHRIMHSLLSPFFEMHQDTWILCFMLDYWRLDTQMCFLVPLPMTPNAYVMYSL